jgi:fermentation-respiration switch protein FrsA (DUF1100 family)
MHTSGTPASQVPAAGSRPERKRRSGLLRLARTGLVVYCLLIGLLMIFEEKLIYFPMRYPAGDWEPQGLAYEDVWFQAADGIRLHGWYAHHDNPRAVILLAHGNAGNITHRAELIRALHQHFSTSVLVFDYRGYGKSEGRPNERGVLLDARAARSWLAHRAGIDPGQVVLMGRSLGGAVAVDLAATEGARGLILEATFTSLPDVAARHYPWAPVRMLMRNRLDSLSKIAGYAGPLLQVHGAADDIIPIDLGRRLFAQARGPKWFVPIADAGHNDWFTAWPHYRTALGEFLDNLD